MSEQEWFVVNTRPNAERYARDFLASKNFSCNVYFPVIKHQEANGKWKVKPFLSRYLFVADDGRGVRHIRDAPGVSNLIRDVNANSSAKVKVAVIDEIREREDAEGFVQLNEEIGAGWKREEFTRGQKVMMLNERGEVMFRGLFQAMSSGKRAEVFVNMMNGSLMRAMLPVNQLVAA